MNPPRLMPAVFIGHGSPMNTLETNRFTAQWKELGRNLRRPRAILAISAHWFIGSTAVTAMPQPRMIHDFYGFPKPLFDFDYPAPGAPALAQEIAALARPMHVALDQDSWGLDHGTWSVLAHLFPDADIPVVQLSVNAQEDPLYHLALGARLAPLRERDVLIVCSGNVVHNLRRLDLAQADNAFDWAQRFDAEVRRIMLGDPGALPDVLQHPDFALAVPTPEHFLPLLYLAGLCGPAHACAQCFCEGGVMGSITMTSYLLGEGLPTGKNSSMAGAAPVPDPASIPPEQTNI